MRHDPESGLHSWSNMHKSVLYQIHWNSFNNVAIICKILPSNNHFLANLSLKMHNKLLIIKHI